jgi:hypothetical protein
MTAQLFLTYLVFVVVAVIGISAAYLPRRMTFAIIAGLAIWLVYVGLFSSLGYMRDPSLRPPGIVWVVGPAVLGILALVFFNIGARVAAAIPLWLILGFQGFRVGVELLVHRLWEDGLMPKLLTYEGGNVDMLVGLSAPIIAWVAMTGRRGVEARHGLERPRAAGARQCRGPGRAQRAWPAQTAQHRRAERGGGDVPLHFHCRLFCPARRRSSRARHPGYCGPAPRYAIARIGYRRVDELIELLTFA